MSNAPASTSATPDLVTAADVVRAERGGILAATVVFLVVLVLASSGMYAFEHRVQPDKFAIVVVGDLAKIEKGIRDANFAPVKVLPPRNMLAVR